MTFRSTPVMTPAPPPPAGGHPPVRLTAASAAPFLAPERIAGIEPAFSVWKTDVSTSLTRSALWLPVAAGTCRSE